MSVCTSGFIPSNRLSVSFGLREHSQRMHYCAEVLVICCRACAGGEPVRRERQCVSTTVNINITIIYVDGGVRGSGVLVGGVGFKGVSVVQLAFRDSGLNSCFEFLEVLSGDIHVDDVSCECVDGRYRCVIITININIVTIIILITA